jgi:N-methylhydantoinase A
MRSNSVQVRSKSRYRVGVDIGGTFTDVQVLNEETGEVFEFKSPTTPSNPAIGLIDALNGAARAYGFDVQQIGLILHGTTIATNAVLEYKMASGALLTTAGFEDVLEIGRHARQDIYGLYAENRRLLIERSLRFGIGERIATDGAVLSPLNETDVRTCARKLAERGIETVAVCLLNACANSVHEKRVREILREENPDLLVSLSTEICPEMREYERSSTTALNALLMPIVRSYARNLRRALAAEQLSANVLLIQSNGGTTSIENAGEQPVRLLLSGPCGGTLALERLARELSEPHLIGIDVGGTSSDIAVIEHGRAAMVTEGTVDGCPVRLPMVDIRTIGAGGGSIAWIDGSGRVRVGPRSAGALPGPACYGRGGHEPTLTDCNVVLGRIDPGAFLGGTMKLEPELARTILGKNICDRLSVSVEEAAEGIVSIAVSHMAGALRLSLFERGLDPADFALVSFGGAGGLMAAMMAQELGIPTVIFPRGASTLSAAGFLSADICYTSARARLLDATPGSVSILAESTQDLLRQATGVLEADHVPAERRRFDFGLDLRYRGQGSELTLPVSYPIDGDALEAAIAAFHDLHEQRFAFAERGAPVEVVTIRLSAYGLLAKPAAQPFQRSSFAATGLKTRPVFIDGAWMNARIYPRSCIGEHEAVEGPCIIEEGYTTIFLPAGWRVIAAATGDLLGHLETLE